MVTWCVTYRFRSAGQWVKSVVYVSADSPEQAAAKVEGMLTVATTIKYEILEVRMVGEGS